jgi:hypothetical protein
MTSDYVFSRHAKERAAQRTIPPMVAEIIIEYGDSRDAGDGALKYTLTKRSMRELRQRAGREITKALDSYRSQNAYVVANRGRIITLAYANHPLSH